MQETPMQNGTDEAGLKEQGPNDPSAGAPPYRVRLPGFITNQDIGLGQAVKRATSAMGFRSCAGCQRRAAALDRWVVFSGPKHL